MKTLGVDSQDRDQASLTDKMSALDRFAASIAHELGNPLIGITYLLDDLSGRAGLSPEDQLLIDAGRTECERMRDLINTLSELHRPVTGSLETLNLNTLATGVLEQYEMTCQDCHVTVESNLTGALPPLSGNASQLSEALGHLVKNALEAMKLGGSLMVRSEYRDKQVYLEVSDTGSGISPEHRDRIFEPLFSTKEPARHKGLGLTVVYRVMLNHNGQVWFTDRQARGSTFTLVMSPPGSSGS